MSTRAIIQIENHNVQLYVHSDGYPDGQHGIIERIRPFVLDFIKHRDFDEAYMMARLTGHMIKLYDGKPKYKVKNITADTVNFDKENNVIKIDDTKVIIQEINKDPNYIGFGLYSNIIGSDMGTDFEYVITKKSIQCNSCGEYVFEVYHKSTTYEITFDDAKERYTVIQNSGVS